MSQPTITPAQSIIRIESHSEAREHLGDVFLVIDSRPCTTCEAPLHLGMDALTYQGSAYCDQRCLVETIGLQVERDEQLLDAMAPTPKLQMSFACRFCSAEQSHIVCTSCCQSFLGKDQGEVFDA